MNADDKIWTCRFCGKHQKLNLKGAMFMREEICFKLNNQQKAQNK